MCNALGERCKGGRVWFDGNDVATEIQQRSQFIAELSYVRANVYDGANVMVLQEAAEREVMTRGVADNINASSAQKGFQHRPLHCVQVNNVMRDTKLMPIA